MKVASNSSSHVPLRHPEMVDDGDQARKVWSARLRFPPPSQSVNPLTFPTHSNRFSQSKEMNSLQGFLPASTSPGDRDLYRPSRTTPLSSSWVAGSNS